MNPQKSLNLLVCDSDPQAQLLIREYLQDSPIRVCFTSPSESFETTLRKHAPFHAVVIDLSNPGRRSCDDLVTKVKQAAPSAQIIFMSRLADEVLWSQVLAQGAYDLLPKPPERTEFLRTVFGAVRLVHAA
jgi:DNA-binding NtrC family response regulator